MHDRLDDLSLHAIMTRWPATIRLFIDLRLHCVGCPIADLHGVADAALEHGHRKDDLRRALHLAIDGGVSPEDRAQSRPRSAAGDGDP